MTGLLIALTGALVAGALTTLAPCSLSLLPVIVGGSVGQTRHGPVGPRRAMLVTAGLGVSVFLFTLVLRASTALINVPTQAWQILSGGLLVALGLIAVFPQMWDRFSVGSGLSSRTARGLSSANQRAGWLGAVITGAALGPVFSSCSPLYAYVVVTVLPAEPGRGLVLLTAYVFGLCAVLLAIGLAGQRLVRRLRWAADPRSWLRAGIGVLFIVLGLLILTGSLQDLESWILAHSPIQPWAIGSGIGRIGG
ncbi:MAG: cytochrome c biogenesis CcdA family protein [Nostocoides sp.]